MSCPHSQVRADAARPAQLLHSKSVRVRAMREARAGRRSASPRSLARPSFARCAAAAGKPIAGVLIGAKSDFRDDDGSGQLRAEVSAVDAAALASSLGLAYFEVSSVSAVRRAE